LADWSRFLKWRRTQPALIHGALQPLDLPEPAVGFVRAYREQQVLCVFNLAETPVSVDLAEFAGLRALADSGVAPDVGPMGAVLPRFGVLLAEVRHATEINEGQGSALDPRHALRAMGREAH
jgi:alpha-glucosidase